MIKQTAKISAFSRVSNYLDGKQLLILYNSFITSQFNYCPLIWMLCGKAAKKDLKRIHKRAFCVLYNEYSSSFEELIHKSNECTIHTKNLQRLMLEIYKFTNKQNPSFMWDMFHGKRNQYDLRSKNLLILPKTNTIRYGNDSIVFRGSTLWNCLQNDIKSAICCFQIFIKSWSGEDCNCQICKK